MQEQFDRAPNDDAKKDVLLRFADNLPVVCRTINGGMIVSSEAFNYQLKCN